jgi:hypothetical protein
VKCKKLQKGKNRVESDDENDESDENDDNEYEDGDDRESSGLSGPTLEIGRSLHLLL